MKWIITILLLCSTILYSQNWKFESYLRSLEKEFTVPQIKPDSVNSTNCLLLDAREIEEYNISHISNAIHVGYNDFELAKLNSINKDTTIVIYCSVGYRSSKIASELIEAGFKDVRNLYGGIFKWVNQKREIVKNSVPTDSLHSYDEDWGRYIFNKDITKVE